MKEYNILDMLYNEPSRTPPYIDFNISVLDEDGNTITLITNDTFKHLLQANYWSFKLVTPSYYNTVSEQYVELIPDVQSACQYLGYKFNKWKDDRQAGFYNLYKALRAKYNPIHNYDKVIDSETQYTGKEKDEYSKSGTETNSKSYGEDTSIISKTPFDSNSFLDNTKEVNQTHTDTDTLSFTNRKDTNEKSFTDRKDIYHYEERGNIGVTTTQQMITSQFPLTELDSLQRYIVNMFVHENLIL